MDNGNRKLVTYYRFCLEMSDSSTIFVLHTKKHVSNIDWGWFRESYGFKILKVERYTSNGVPYFEEVSVNTRYIKTIRSLDSTVVVTLNDEGIPVIHEDKS